MRADTRERLDRALDDLCTAMAETSAEVRAVRDELHPPDHDVDRETPPTPPAD